MAERSPGRRALAHLDKRGPRRLLEKLRGGRANHDLPRVAMAQLLVSPEQGQAMRVGDDSDAEIASDPCSRATTSRISSRDPSRAP